MSGETAPSRGALLVVAGMLLTIPLVYWQGPGHTTAMDAIAVPFIVIYWALILTRRETVSLPLLVPFWLIMLGSLGGLVSASDRGEALLTMVQDVYLYAWFVTMAHFLAHHCRLDRVARVWVAIATMVAFLAVADRYLGVFGGQFSASSVRATGTFENPNMFGNYLNIALFLAWAAAAGGQRLLFLAIPLLLAGTLATASNGTLVSLVGGCAATVAFYPSRRPLRRVGALLVLGALGFAVLGLWDERMSQAVIDRMSAGRGVVGGAAAKGGEERLALWRDAAQIFVSTPTGVGPGNFTAGTVSGDYHSAHSDYVGMLLERGPLGLIGYGALLASVVLPLTRLRAAAAVGVRVLAVEPLYGVMATIGLHALVMEVFHFRHFWLTLALIVAFATQATVRARSMAPSPRAIREAA
jgi:hypothetical protein